MVSSNFVFILIFLKTTQGLLSDIKLPATEYNSDSIPECVTKIFKKEILSNSIVFIVSSNSHHKTLLQSINTYYHFSAITRSFDEQEWLVFPDAYLIAVKSYFEFFTGINTLSKDSSWNPAAKFIIIYKNMGEDRNEMLEVFNVLLKNNIINVVLIKKSKNDDLELFTYFPYSGSSCGKNASDIKSLGNCRSLNDNILFPDKVPNGIRNCTVLVMARECAPYVITENGSYSQYLDTGIEQYVFETIAKYEGFNYELKYIDPKEGYGVVLPNKTITGLLGHLQYENVTFVLGGMFLLKNRMEMFDFIYGYNYALFSIFTPVTSEQKWSRVYRQFGSTTWGLIIISFLFTTTIILIILSVTSGKPKDKLMIILKIWRYFYGQVDDNLFRQKHLKVIIFVWIIFTNSVCAFYNTALYSLITGHVQDQIHINPNDLASLPFTPCISDQIRTFFKFSYSEIFPKGDNNPICQNTDTAFEGVATRTDLYTIDTDYAYFMRGSQYEDAEGGPKIKKWDFPRNLVFCMYMSKGFPLRHSFQKHALDFYERGLLQRHLTNLFAKKPLIVSNLKNKCSPIRLEDFIIHFSILIIGALISFITFLLELRAGKKKMC